MNTVRQMKTLLRRTSGCSRNSSCAKRDYLTTSINQIEVHTNNRSVHPYVLVTNSTKSQTHRYRRILLKGIPVDSWPDVVVVAAAAAGGGDTDPAIFVVGCSSCRNATQTHPASPTAAVRNSRRVGYLRSIRARPDRGRRPAPVAAGRCRLVLSSADDADDGVV